MPTTNSFTTTALEDLVFPTAAPPWPSYMDAKKKTREETGKPKKAREGFTFGCDPEGFIFEGDKPIPASKAGIPGSKERPYRVLGGAIQVDGMAAEFNIDPVDTYEDWESNIQVVIEQLESLLPDGLCLKFVPSVVFDEDTFNKAPDKAKAIGCMPDVDAYTGQINPIPMSENVFMRCAGGHIHLGWPTDNDARNLQHTLACRDIAKQLDWFLGAWSILNDGDKERRKTYGKAGAIRYKPYGVEYRTLSNFWVTAPELRLEVWNRMNEAVNTMAKIYVPDQLAVFSTKLQSAIEQGIADDSLLSVGQYPIQTLNSRARQF